MLRPGIVAVLHSRCIAGLLANASRTPSASCTLALHRRAPRPGPRRWPRCPRPGSPTPSTSTSPARPRTSNTADTDRTACTRCAPAASPCSTSRYTAAGLGTPSWINLLDVQGLVSLFGAAMSSGSPRSTPSAGLLANVSRTLCVGACLSQEVASLRSVRVADAVGIDLTTALAAARRQSVCSCSFASKLSFIVFGFFVLL